jgi:hypothetical protein
MKGNKYKIIVLTLILLCLCSVPVYALSLSYASKITNLGSYVGGYSYTAGSGYDYYVVNSYLFEDGVVVDSDYDNNLSWAQADVGINNPSGTQYWNILGHHYAYLNGNQTFRTSNDYGQS